MGLLCFQLADGDWEIEFHGYRLQSPDGASLFSTLNLTADISAQILSCNPLMGLLCFQLAGAAMAVKVKRRRLQSPDGASLFSTGGMRIIKQAIELMLQSPDGASLFSTGWGCYGGKSKTAAVAIP